MEQRFPSGTAQAPAPLYVAIDIGTVTCRLMVARVGSGTFDVLARRSSFVHLGEDVDKTGVLKPEAIARTDAKVAEYLEIVEEVVGDEPYTITGIATSASRDASNSDELIEALAARGVALQIVPGEREAAFCFAGATGDYAGEQVLVVDTGGGSTELIAGIAGSAPDLSHSFQIGCRRVTERFYRTDPPTPEELAAAQEWMEPQFASYFDDLAARGFTPERIIAVAGTATSMVSIDQAMEPYDPDRVHGTVLPASTLGALYERLRTLPLAERERVVGLQPQRAPLIVAGAQILQTVLALSKSPSFTISESDLLEGIILLTAAQA